MQGLSVSSANWNSWLLVSQATNPELLIGLKKLSTTNIHYCY